jgi:hypothetical protein
MDHLKSETVNSTIWRRKIDDFHQARSFDVGNNRFQHQFYDFVPTEIRIHDPWIRFQHNNIQRRSDHGFSAS